MKKSIFAKMFAVAAFAVALPMMAIDVEKELVPMIPEGADVLVGVDLPALLDAPLSKKYLPELVNITRTKNYLLEAVNPSQNQDASCAGADFIAKVDKALVSQNLKRADFKDVFIIANVLKPSGYVVFFTKATLENMKVIGKAAAPKIEFKDATVFGFKAISYVEKGQTIFFAQVKPGVLIMADEFGIKDFATGKKIAPSAPIIQKFPKKDFLAKFAVTPGTKDPTAPQMVTGCMVAQGENINVKAKIVLASADSAKELCDRANMQIGMEMEMLAMQEPKFAELVQKSLKIESDASDMNISLVLSPALVESFKEFQAKQAAARGGMGAPGMEIDEGATDDDKK